MPNQPRASKQKTMAATGKKSKSGRKRKTTKKKGAAKKTTRKKAARKRTVKKKTTRKKSARKTRKKTARKKTTQKKGAGKRALSVKKQAVRRKQRKRQPRIDASTMYALYEEGLSLLHENSYSRARAKFAQLIQEFAIDTEVTARAQAFIKVCDKHLQKRKAQAETPEQVFNEGVFHHNAGRYQEALDTLSRALKLSKRSKDHIYYAMAAAEVSLGNTDQGLKLLRKALDLNTENRFFAGNDPDFEPLAENQAFQKLINPEE